MCNDCDGESSKVIFTSLIKKKKKTRKAFLLRATIYDKRGRVLSTAENSYTKTHPIQSKYATKVGRPEAIYLHAEVRAISLCKDLSKAHRIHIERYDTDGVPVNASPCIICSAVISEMTPIKVITHT